MPWHVRGLSLATARASCTPSITAFQATAEERKIGPKWSEYKTQQETCRITTDMSVKVAIPSMLSDSTLNPSSLLISNLKCGWSLLVGHLSSSSDGGGSSSAAEAAPDYTNYKQSLSPFLNLHFPQLTNTFIETYHSIRSSLSDCCVPLVPMFAVCLVHPG